MNSFFNQHLLVITQCSRNKAEKSAVRSGTFSLGKVGGGGHHLAALQGLVCAFGQSAFLTS